MSIVRDIVYAGGLVVTSPLWAVALARTGKWRSDWPARFGRCERLPACEAPTLMIHGVSVGEVNAVRGLVAQLEAETDWRLVISSTTNTGFARAVALYGQRHTVVRFPFDLGMSVRGVLDAVRPDAVALVELEVWPNFVEACEKRRVPVCVINGRLSERSFRGYRWLRPVLRPTFARLAAVGAQTEAYAERFRASGTPADRVQVLDSMKWDNAKIEDRSSVAGADELAAAMGIDRDRPVIVAGSTGPGEERLLIDTCPPTAQLVLVPRKPERFEEVAALAPADQLVRRSQHREGVREPSAGQRLFLLDTIGELRPAYALADVALVGRSFLGLHGSDLTEPIALGVPTVIGPHHSDFQDMVDAFVAGGGVIVSDEPGRIAGELLADRDRALLGERGRAVIRARQGATRRHVAMLRQLVRTTRGDSCHECGEPGTKGA